MAMNPTIWVQQSDELRKAIEENDQALEAKRQRQDKLDANTQRIWMAALTVGGVSVLAAAIGIFVVL